MYFCLVVFWCSGLLYWLECCGLVVCCLYGLVFLNLILVVGWWLGFLGWWCSDVCCLCRVLVWCLCCGLGCIWDVWFLLGCCFLCDGNWWYGSVVCDYYFCDVWWYDCCCYGWWLSFVSWVVLWMVCFGVGFCWLFWLLCGDLVMLV